MNEGASTVCVFADWLDEPTPATVDAATTALVLMLAAHAAAHGFGDWIPAALWARHAEPPLTRRAELAGLVAPATRDGLEGFRFTSAVLAHVDTLAGVKRRNGTRVRVARFRERRRALELGGAAQPALTFADSTCAKPVDVTPHVTPHVTRAVTLEAPRLTIRARAGLQDLDQASVVQEHDATRRRPCVSPDQVPAPGPLLCALVGRERDADPSLQLPTPSSRRRLLDRVFAIARRARLLVGRPELVGAIRQVEVARARTSPSSSSSAPSSAPRATT